jgi:hypothetical protein
METALAKLRQFEIDKSILLAPHLHLYSLGQPYIRSKEWFSCLLEEDMRQEWIFPLHKLVTRREHFSLDSPNTATVYYQTLLVVNNQVYYCIVDERRPELIFYHTNCKELVRQLNEASRRIRKEKEEEMKEAIPIRRPFMATHPPRELIPTAIIANIQQEL